MWLLCLGNVVEGFEFIGPFETHEAAFAVGEELYGDGAEPAWGTCSLQSEAHARADAAWAAGFTPVRPGHR
jgi:hypothetical protein